VKYLYYPGCSLKSTGKPYEESMLAVFSALGQTLEEIDDWNCCGATAYMSISETKAFALSARNFALAEQHNGKGEVNMVVPCAACYLGLNKAQRYLREHDDLRQTVSKALADAGLTYRGKVKVRHPLDVLINDVGEEAIKQRVTQPLKGLKVACYYGCQLIRPYADFDDQHEPTSMDRIVTALGGKPVDWPLKTRCCGGSLTGTIPDVGLRLSYVLLREAQKRGCDVVITACPLCQFNLECYQPEMSRSNDTKINIPVVYFSQLMGVAFGLERRALGLQRLFVPFALPVTAAEKQGGVHVSA
jgi:heterodisulfide reductase subunit B2